jgi:hypothetical protein
MAYDLLRGPTPHNWARPSENPSDSGAAREVGVVPTTPTVPGKSYTPERYWTAAQAEAQAQALQKSGGLFGVPLPREQAEKKTLEAMRAQKIGLMSGIGSWIISEKEQLRLLNKIDDVRYDMRLASRRAGIGLGLLAGSLGLLGIASLYRTSKTGA